MRITFLAPCKDLSGGIKVMAAYGNELIKRGHTVTVVYPAQRTPLKRKFKQALIKFIKHRKDHLDYFKGNLLALDKIDNSTVPPGDIMIATAWETADWALKLSPDKGLKFYLIQGLEIWNSPKEKVFNTYQYPFQKITVSPWLKEKITNLSGDQNIDLILNGCDIKSEDFSVYESERKYDVGYVYSAIPNKRAALGLDVIKTLAEKNRHLKFIIFGTDPVPLGKLPPNTKVYVQPSKNKIKKIYRSAKIWLSTSGEEGFGLPALEATSSGAVVVSSDNKGVNEIIKNNQNGFIVRQNYKSEFVLRITQLIENSHLLKTFRQAGLKKSKEFSWERSTDQLESILNKHLEISEQADLKSINKYRMNMKKIKFKRIAYLAPELPALSSTFVNNEIWALEKFGVVIKPYSVHRPQQKAHGAKADYLASNTAILYDLGFMSLLKAFINNSIRHKSSTLKGFLQLGTDVFKVGIFKINGLKLVYQFIVGAWLANNMRRKNVEHLHIHFAHVPTQIGMYAATLAGIPFSFMAHANDIFERPLLLKEKIERSAKTITISRFNLNLLEKYGADPQKMELVRCGVDSERLITKPQKNRILKIGTLGRLVGKKGMDTVLEMARILKMKKIEFKLEIAGDGPLNQELKTMAAIMRLENNITFLGAIPNSEALHWMKNLNAFILASKKDENGDMDGIPVALMEAMNLGVPVLSTSISGIPELVIHGKTGLLSEPGNAQELAKNLILLHKNEPLRSALTAEAKDWIKTEFDQTSNAERLNNIFNPQLHAAA